MIIVTDRAAEALGQIRLMHGAHPCQGVRLVMGGLGRIGMTIDTARDTDEVIRQDGVLLLILDVSLASRLARSKIDCSTVVVGSSSRTEFLVAPAA